MKECVDITEQYLKNATPDCGEMIKQEGYSESLPPNEVTIAK